MRTNQLLIMKFTKRFLRIKDEIKLTDEWQSYDRTPWNHPWLTQENLERFKYCSERHRKRLVNRLDDNRVGMKFGVFGNMANSMYTRATVLRQKGIQCDVILHPQDDFIMSHPAWEEFEGDISDESRNYKDLVARGLLQADKVGSVFQYSDIGLMPSTEECCELGINAEMSEMFPSYMLFYKTFQHINRLSSSICTQSLFFGLFSGSPYSAVSLGGDLWLEASRNDALGYLQRLGYANANYILASDPLTIANCRRFGFRNAIYIPHYLDQSFYSPGESSLKKVIHSRNLGDFYILSTGRLDVSTKGTNIAADAILTFLKRNSGARLMQLSWGSDLKSTQLWFERNGVSSQIIWLPVSGKKKLVEYLRLADCFVGQFVLGAYGHADLEAMACGVPVIGYINKTSYGALCPTGVPPIINVKEATGILDGLELLKCNPNYARDLGRRLRVWFENNHGSEKWYIDHLAILHEMAKRGRKVHRNRALNRRLNKHEIEYHKEQFINAPKYPTYEVG